MAAYHDKVRLSYQNRAKFLQKEPQRALERAQNHLNISKSKKMEDFPVKTTHFQPFRQIVLYKTIISTVKSPLDIFFLSRHL